MILTIARRSLLNRKGSAFLTLLSLVVSVSLLISVEHIRKQAKESFSRTVSGVDLIVGARTGQLNLLLYSVFRVGNPSNNIDWESYQAIAESSMVKWSIPMSLGDSHRGYRVLGTTQSYFEHYSYGNKLPLTFAQGQAFDGLFETVLGAEVAAKLGYQLGDEITISHGVGQVSFKHHDEAPFVITGILAPTGTPVDKTVHITLGSMEAIHLSPGRLTALASS